MHKLTPPPIEAKKLKLSRVDLASGRVVLDPSGVEIEVLVQGSKVVGFPSPPATLSPPQAQTAIRRCAQHLEWTAIEGPRGKGRQCTGCGFQELLERLPCPDCGATALTHECTV